MGVDRSFIVRNDTERARLRALVTRLSDADLDRAMPGGWTVAGVLAHVAFWDQRVLVLLERWEQSRSAVPPPANQADVDWINDAAKPLMLALPPRRAAEIALAVAEAVDRKLETLPDDLVARNAATGSPLNFARADHRRQHLDEIERAIPPIEREDVESSLGRSALNTSRHASVSSRGD